MKHAHRVAFVLLLLATPVLSATRSTARYYCTAYVPGQSRPHLHTTTSDRFAFAYRSALQECRYWHPTIKPRCVSRCLRLR